MFLRHGLLAVLLCLLSSVVLAEGRCPPGMFETGSRDYLACAPIPGYEQGNNSDSSEYTPPPIPTVWETRWGAFATESNGGGFGAVNGFKSEPAAKQAALQQCQGTASASKANCKVLIAYHDQCGVYAWGGGEGIAQSAIDLPTASERALKSCNTASGAACKIYYSGCSYAEAVPK